MSFQLSELFNLHPIQTQPQPQNPLTTEQLPEPTTVAPPGQENIAVLDYNRVLRNVSKQTLLAVKDLPGRCCFCCPTTVGYWLTDASENDVIFADSMKDYGSRKHMRITTPTREPIGFVYVESDWNLPGKCLKMSIQLPIGEPKFTAVVPAWDLTKHMYLDEVVITSVPGHQRVAQIKPSGRPGISTEAIFNFTVDMEVTTKAIILVSYLFLVKCFDSDRYAYERNLYDSGGGGA